MLGAAAMKMGALVQAEGFIREAMARGYQDKDITRQLATCLNQQERLGDALELFNHILDRWGPDSQVSAVKATILDKLGRNDEAREIWTNLVAQDPSKPSLWVGLGHNLRHAGLTEEAIAAHKRAIAIEPDHGEAWWGIGSIKQNVFNDDDIRALHEGLRIAIDLHHKTQLHFTLGRALHLRKQHEQAFGHFSEANRLWAQSIKYNPDELSAEITEAAMMFDEPYWRSLPPAGDPSTAPIFIVSLPRSGSTLLEQMLDQHLEIEALGELSYGPALLRSLMERATSRARTTVPQAIAALSRLDRDQLGHEYLRRAAIHRQTDAPRFIDKLPHNWNNVIFLRHILPSAKFIDIRRNPVDCCFANFSHSFTRAHASSFALEDIGRAYVDYVRLMDHLGRAAPGMVHHVRYEELIEEPERVLRGVLDYLGLPWDEACLRFHESKRTVRTPSAEQVRRPLNREGVGAWKPYEQWLGPLFEALRPVLEREPAASDSA